MYMPQRGRCVKKMNAIHFLIVGRAAVPAIDAWASAPTLTDELRWV
jgi:hypothetical protein